MAVSEMAETWNSWVSHPFRRKTRKGRGTEVYSKSENALTLTPAELAAQSLEKAALAEPHQLDRVGGSAAAHLIASQ